MTAYRVLVSHRDLKMKTVVHLDPTEQVRYLVEAGYLKAMEEVTEVEGTAVAAGPVDADPAPRRGKRTRKAEVTDVPDSSVPDTGPVDGEEPRA